MSAPAVNLDEALDFLRILDPVGPHNLVAMVGEEKPTIAARTFEPGEWSEIAEWLQRHHDQNLFYSVNRPKDGAVGTSRKLADTDIAAARALFIDLDPDKSLPFAEGRRAVEARASEILSLNPDDLLDEVDNRPSLVVDTGGGFQMLWRLEEPIDAAHADEWRARNAALVARLGADAPVKGLSQLLRLPGTVNFPNAKKRATGRAPAPARLVRSSDRRFLLAEMEAVAPPAAVALPAQRPATDWQKTLDRIDLGGALGRVDYTELPVGLRERFERALRRDPVRLGALWQGLPDGLVGQDDTGSGFVWSLAARLNHAGFSAQDFADLVLVWEHGGDRAKIEDGRAIARAWSKAEASEQAHRPRGSDEFDDTTIDLPAPVEHAPRPRLFAVSFEESAALALADAPPPLIEGLLDQETLSVVYGPSNGGKTFVVMDLAFHIASGRTWNGRAVTPGLAVYVAAEGGRNIHKRIAALRAHYAPAGPVAFELVPCPIDLRNDQSDVRALVNLITDAEAKHGQKARLVVIDTLSRALAGGDENASTDMGNFIRNVDKLRGDARAAAIVVHHSGKDTARGMRGWSGLLGALDTELEVEPAADKRGGMLRATKQRDMPLGDPLTYRLIDVPLGEAGNSCVVQFVSADFIQIELPPDGHVMLEALRFAVEAAVDDGAAGPTRVSGEQWAEAYAAIGGMGKRAKLSTLRQLVIQSGFARRVAKGAFELVEERQP